VQRPSTTSFPATATLDRVLLLAAKGDPLEEALRRAQPAPRTLIRLDGVGAVFEGLLRGRDWDAAVLVAGEATATADAIAALHRHDPNLSVLVVCDRDDAVEASVWRALGAQLVLARGDVVDLASELRALRSHGDGDAPPPVARDLDDAKALADGAVGLLRAAAAADADAVLAATADALRRAVGAALVETWVPHLQAPTRRPERTATDAPAADEVGLRPGPAAADEAALRGLRIGLDDAARPRDGLIHWVLERGLGVSVPDLIHGNPVAESMDRSSAAAPRFVRHAAAWAAGLRAVHAEPFWVGGEMTAVLLLAWRDARDLEAGVARASWLLRTLAVPLTWRRRAEVATASQTLEERAWSQVADGVAACDAAGRLALRNHAIERLGFGGRVGDAPERWRDAWRITDPADRPVPAGDDPLSRAYRGETLVQARYVGASPEGRRRPLLVDAAPVEDADGHPTGAIVTVRDATSAVAASARSLAATERALEEFRSLLDRAAELAAAMGEAGELSDLWGPLDGFVRATTPAAGWRVRRADGTTLAQRGRLDEAGARIETTLRVGERELGTLELRGAPTVAFDELHATAAVMAANLVGVALDHADLVVQEREGRQRAEDAARRLRALFDASPAAVLVAGLDDGEVLDVNLAFEALLGYPRTALLGSAPGEPAIWVDGAVDAGIRRDVAAGTTVRDREVRLRHRDGGERHCLAAAERTEHLGRPALLLTLLDVTDRLAREAQLQQLASFREALMGFVEQTLEQGFEGTFYQRLVEAAVRATPGAEAGSLLLRDEDGSYRFAAAVGYERHDVADAAAAPQRAQHAQHAQRAQHAIAASLTVPIHLDGRRVATLTLDAFGRADAFGDGARELAAAFAAQAATLVKRRALERELERLAYHDALTGLPNRTLFRDRLGQAIARAVRSGHRGAALFLDLDNLKVTNDTLGHSVGDALLSAVAQRLRTSLRADDTVARVGGDEFCLILPEVQGADAAALVAEKLLAHLRRPFTIGGHELHVSASIGIALFPDDAIDADVLIQHGDTAMYQAKAQGKDRYRFFTREMNRTLLERAVLEAHLRKALDRDELTLHYQPRVSLQDGTITSVEALARWPHPERGWVPPSAFIPVAEDAGLISPLSRLLLETACRQARAWIEQGCGVVVAYNLSATQLQDRDVVAQVEEVLALTGLEGRWLELEITESAVMRNVEENVVKLAALRGLGVTVSIDDFGTGYSSLNYLKRLPASALKIDRSFITDLDGDPAPHDAGIVRAVIALAHTLGLRAIAEGIETPAQLAFLQALGCEQGQGYLFARPASVADVTPLLVRGRIDLPTA
jgi:diguanylate cyclase (GGDEF)-like protein/PAS domain S-box-containing protein